MSYSSAADLEGDGTLKRAVTRRQVLRFYLWSLRPRQNYRTLGCAAMFTYLTGFRAVEVRPFLKTGIRADGVVVLSAKCEKGQKVVEKARDWSTRLRCGGVCAGAGCCPIPIPVRAVPKTVHLLLAVWLGFVVAGRHECLDPDARWRRARGRPSDRPPALLRSARYPASGHLSQARAAGGRRLRFCGSREPEYNTSALRPADSQAGQRNGMNSKISFGLLIFTR